MDVVCHFRSELEFALGGQKHSFLLYILKHISEAHINKIIGYNRLSTGYQQTAYAKMQSANIEHGLVNKLQLLT